MRRGDREIAGALRELRAPGEAEAERRSWEVVRAAHAERATVRPAYRARRLAVAVALGVALIAIGLSPAGAKVVDLVSDVVGPGVGEENARPALRSLPAPGELLVESRDGPWIVREDGSKRRLGDYEQAGWSPHGVYVVVARGRELAALDTAGNVRWTYPAPGPVRDPRWAGDSLDTRIAYLSGDDLRVIAGDGNPATDHPIARNVAPVAPAWRPIGYSKVLPGTGFVLTYVDRDGRARTVDADTGDRLATKPRDLARLGSPGGSAKSALAPDASRAATVERARGHDRLVLSGEGERDRVLFSARGTLTAPTWSPDGRWLLVGWPAADQWLFIDADHPRRVVPFGQISEQFGAAAGGGRAGFPRVSGWILPER